MDSEQLKKEITDNIKQELLRFLDSYKASLTQAVEGMFKEAKTVNQFMATSGTGVGYNKALKDVLTLISSQQ